MTLLRFFGQLIKVSYGSLGSAALRSDLGNRVVINTDQRVRVTSAGREITLDITDQSQISFETTVGATYHIKVVE